jgi:hypothetical protein
MPDWNQYVREHLSLPKCSPERETEIVEELAQQLDDAYQEGVLSGLSEQEALLRAQRHISDWPTLASDLMHAGFGEPRRPARQPFSEPATAAAPPHQVAFRQLPSTDVSQRSIKTGFSSLIGMLRQDLH